MFVHPSNRYRLYVDETGIQSLKRAETDRFLCLMGVVMRQDAHDGPVTDRLVQIKHDLFGHSADTPVILHRRAIVRGEAPFDILRKNENVAAAFNARWTALVHEAPYLAIAAAIDKQAHVERYRVWQYDPYHYCLECLLERFVQWLNRHGFVGDVLIEARGKGQDKKLKAAYKRFYQNGNSHVSATVAQARLTSVEPKFAMKSDDIAALQLADSFAYPTLRFMRAEKLGEAVPATFGQGLVQILLDDKFSRHPTNHKINGWGLKWLP